MKRSEMLGKIAAVIINYNEPHRYTDRETAIEIAETILKVQEEAGMQPPENYRVHDNGMFIIEGWEDEDEQ